METFSEAAAGSARAVGTWRLVFYEDPDGRQPVREFLDGLDPLGRAALVEGLERILSREGLNVCGARFGNMLGKGLCEFRLDLTAEQVRAAMAYADGRATKASRVLFRVFFHAYGDRLILLLAAYDKGRDSSTRRQQKEIKAANAALAQWNRAQRRKPKDTSLGG